MSEKATIRVSFERLLTSSGQPIELRFLF